MYILEDYIISLDTKFKSLYTTHLTFVNYGTEGTRIEALSRMKDFVKGISEIKIKHDGVCKGCALAKNVKEQCTKSSSDSRSKGILDLVHSNVYGPMSNKSLGGHLYYVTYH